MTSNSTDHDSRLLQYIKATENLKQGNYDVELYLSPLDDTVGRLGMALHDLAQTLEKRYHELQKLDQITRLINAGLLLDEILENIYRDFRELIPYNRIGCALLEDEGRILRARWAKSDQPEIRLYVGYEARMEGSSLEQILQTGRPRIINDLTDYLRRKPASESSRLVHDEGIRSSLTCPLIASGVPVGFIFFSSSEPDTYKQTHIHSYLRIAEQLSVIVEKGRLVSELAAQKAAIEQKNAELLRLNDLKNQFLGIAAHDLRNPISYIQMASEFLLFEPTLSEEYKTQMLEDITGQAEHMLMLLNELLDVTQIESGRLDLKPREVDLAAFLQEAVTRHARMAAPKGTEVTLLELPEGTVHADPERLRQVIDNLISNAVKYSPTNSMIRVLGERTPDAWRISVMDEGPGIKPEERAQLFQEFSRLSARPTGGETSTGLG
ncbi:MAG: GAF domain-containing sensor histidine kinase, partial [Anaerolineae bacterium]|nr:GAF domain-containing sensor histidine kinase [Anaerolineae bacterium]